MSAPGFVEKWMRYAEDRRGDYAYRSRTRYRAVANRLFSLGLTSRHSILDVGAGTKQFGTYLRMEEAWFGVYKPVDAVLDGRDLNYYEAERADFIVCIEVLEHLTNPGRLLDSMGRAARRAVVITTPNSMAVDVLACDPTHVSVIRTPQLLQEGYTVELHSWFGVPDDSLLAWRVTR